MWAEQEINTLSSLSLSLVPFICLSSSQQEVVNWCETGLSDTHTHTHNRKQMVKKRYQNSVCCEGEQAQIIGRMGENNDRSVHEKMKEILTMYGLYVLSFFVLCLLISQNSNAQMPRHTADTHSGYGERCQCASVHLNRAGVLHLQYTHTHQANTE